MSGKRQRPCDFQNSNKDQDNNQKQEPSVDNPERIIYKIKRPANIFQKNTIFNFPSPIFGPTNYERTSLFGSSTNTNMSIFSSEKKPDSLFFSSPFNFQTKPIFGEGKSFGSLFSPKMGFDEQESEGESEELQRQQEIDVAPVNKVLHYQYKNECPVIFTERALKFKKNQGKLVEIIDVLIQEDKKLKTNWLTARIASSKSPIFAGIFLKGKCQLRHFADKQENVLIQLFTFARKPILNKIKIQFDSAEKGKQFFHTFCHLQEGIQIESLCEKLSELQVFSEG